MDKVQFDKMYTHLIGKETFASLLFESFLRQTKNKEIKDQFISYIKNHKINNKFIETIERLYKSTENKLLPSERR